MKNVKKILLLFLCGMMITFIQNVNAEYCFQEQANGSSNSDGNCNFDYNGNYFVSVGDFKWADGDYNTKNSVGAYPIYDINYSMNPILNTTRWQIKWSSNGGIGTTTSNFSIPLSCSNSSESFLQLRIRTFFLDNVEWMNLSCYNGTMSVFNNTNADITNGEIYEESLWWNISNPRAENVSITPLPLISGNAKGHSFYNSTDNLISNGNQTYWYVNKTLVLEANNSFILLAGNVTDKANITFSARFNDTYRWGKWINSSNLLVSDTTIPQIFNANWSSLSITNGDQVNVRVNATDNGFLQDINISVVNPNGLAFNRRCSNINLNNYLCNITFFDGDETIVNGLWNLTNVSAMDTSNNVITTYPNVTMRVNPASSGGGGGASGGGGGTAIVKEKLIGSIPILSFGGITTMEFIVISTPRKQVKIARFANIGNTSFESANIFIEGDAKKYVKPFVCNLDLQNCKNQNIFIKPKESVFLSLNGSFTNELKEGTSGVVKIQETKQNGNTYEINLLIARPPLYKLAIKPFSDITGLSELYSIIILYSSMIGIIMGLLLVYVI